MGKSWEKDLGIRKVKKLRKKKKDESKRRLRERKKEGREIRRKH